MTKEVLQDALELLAVATFITPKLQAKRTAVINAGLQALEQQAQQEPVAWPCLIAEADFSADTVTLAMRCTDYKVSAGEHWLSNTPPAQRTWVGLTDSEIQRLGDLDVDSNYFGLWYDFAKSIEAKLRSKNEDRN